MAQNDDKAQESAAVPQHKRLAQDVPNTGSKVPEGGIPGPAPSRPINF